MLVQLRSRVYLPAETVIEGRVVDALYFIRMGEVEISVKQPYQLGEGVERAG